MNFLVRAKVPPRLLISSVQQLNPYSTRIGCPKAEEPAKPRTQKSSEWSESDDDRFCPRPTEIPYEEKLANSVNLSGRVKGPVRVNSSFCPNNNKVLTMAATSLVEVNEDISLSIPLLFKNDLASVANYHLEENDFIYVTGQLIMKPMAEVMSRMPGKFHVVVQNINFVDDGSNVLDGVINGRTRIRRNFPRNLMMSKCKWFSARNVTFSGG